MIRQYSLLAIGAFALIAGVSDAQQLGIIRESERAAPGEFPYQVMVYGNSSSVCGGAIISKRHVITSALCVINTPVESINVMVGSINITNGYFHSVKTVKLHNANSFLSDVPYDVAILEVYVEITFDIVRNKVELPVESTVGGVAANMTAWRDHRTILPTEEDYLIKNTIVTLHPRDYAQTFRSHVLDENLIFTQTIQYRTGPCIGNLGSPLVSNGRLIGIDSYGSPCDPKNLGIYTNVYDLTGWIRSIIGE